MMLYMTRWFRKWAGQSGLTSDDLCRASGELERGMADALGGHVYKMRLAMAGRGKRGGARVIVAFRQGESVFFIYGYPKNERSNITPDELRALRLLARQLLSYDLPALGTAISQGELFEVGRHGKR